MIRVAIVTSAAAIALSASFAMAEANLAAAPVFGDDTAALPSIGRNIADLKARLAALDAGAKPSGAFVLDQNTFKTAFGDLRRHECSDCH